MPEYVRNIQALNDQQKCWFRSIDQYPIHILAGPAGVGKTYIATAEGCSRLDKGTVERLVFLRPHVTTEEIGFLPGDLQAKMDPFMLPLVDVALSRLSSKRYNKYIEENKIEIAALAYLRGRTFHNSWIIFDEAQNSTPAQMRMVLTRLGENTTIIITGDESQSDLREKNGLTWAKDKLQNCPIVHTTIFTANEVVRSETVKELLKFIGD